MNAFVDNENENGQTYGGVANTGHRYTSPNDVVLNDFVSNASGIWHDGNSSFASSSEPPISNSSVNSSDCNTDNAINPNAVTYDRLIQMIKGLDLHDDGITMNHKIKSIEIDYCTAIVDEDMLCESMDYINGKALDDADVALKFALLFASRNFDALAMKDTKIRNAMLTLLEKNFINADLYRSQNRKRLYNSITLLGEYYHRVRVANDSPIKVLGESLLRLLIDEVSLQHNANDLNLAKLVLSQITLNGSIMRDKHQTEIAQLLFQIRKNLIEQPDLKANIKAIFLMTLDLYYNNFNCLGPELEKMYTNYYMMDDDNAQSEINTPPATEVTTCIENRVASLDLSHNVSYEDQKEDVSDENQSSPEFNNSNEYNECLENDDVEDEEHNGVKWSEQLGDDCFLNNFINNSTSNPDEILEHNNSTNTMSYEPKLLSSSEPQRLFAAKHNSRRCHQPARSNAAADNRVCDEDDTKPLPRWRTTRLSRNDQLHGGDNNSRSTQRYYRHNHQDDQHSVRSENENIRLYSINDRLKHDHDKIARAGHSSYYDAIVNSNWDRRSQRDDRSERSYFSNYERGNPHRRGNRGLYNNRSTYNKPPRFQKNSINTNLNSSPNTNNQLNADDRKITSISWRRSSYNKSSDLDLSRHGSHTELQHNNNSEMNRSRTLPRTNKSRADRSSDSREEFAHRNRNPGNKYDKTRGRSFNQRHNSQDNVNSESFSSNLEPLHQRSVHNSKYKNTMNNTGNSRSK